MDSRTKDHARNGRSSGNGNGVLGGETHTQAVILAAGEGRRLGGGVPKCLRTIGPQPLIKHQLASLRRAGVEDVCVVAGHERSQVRRVLGDAVRYIVNSHYRETNSLYSFLLAGQCMSGDGDVVILNSDLLFHPTVLHAVLQVGGSAFAYDSASGHAPEHMKIELRRGRLVQMRKDLRPERRHGENIGLVRLDAVTARETLAAAGRIVRAGHRREWLASALNAVAPRRPLRGIDVAGAPWIEIDFPHDLKAARRVVWPAILSGNGSVAPMKAAV
jgi:choline kinase